MQALEPCALHVNVSACCLHLAGLTQLTHLELASLVAIELPVAPAQPAAASNFEQLLAGMTQLQELTLNNVGLTGRPAMHIFSEIVSKLHLRRLSVTDQLGPLPVSALAHAVRQLPALGSVT